MLEEGNGHFLCSVLQQTNFLVRLAPVPEPRHIDKDLSALVHSLRHNFYSWKYSNTLTCVSPIFLASPYFIGLYDLKCLLQNVKVVCGLQLFCGRSINNIKGISITRQNEFRLVKLTLVGDI